MLHHLARVGTSILLATAPISYLTPSNFAGYFNHSAQAAEAKNTNLLADKIAGKFVLKADVGYMQNFGGKWAFPEGTINSKANGGVGYGASLGYIHRSGFGLSADYLGFNSKWSGEGKDYDAAFHVFTLIPSYRFSFGEGDRWGVKLGLGLGFSLSDIKWGSSDGAAQGASGKAAGGAAYGFNSGRPYASSTSLTNVAPQNQNCAVFTDSSGAVIDNSDNTLGNAPLPFKPTSYLTQKSVKNEFFHVQSGKLVIPANTCLPDSMFTDVIGNTSLHVSQKTLEVRDQADFDQKLATALAAARAANPSYPTPTDIWIRNLILDTLGTGGPNDLNYRPITTDLWADPEVSLAVIPPVDSFDRTSINGFWLYGEISGQLSLRADIIKQQADAALPAKPTVSDQLAYVEKLQQADAATARAAAERIALINQVPSYVSADDKVRLQQDLQKRETFASATNTTLTEVKNNLNAIDISTLSLADQTKLAAQLRQLLELLKAQQDIGSQILQLKSQVGSISSGATTSNTSKTGGAVDDAGFVLAPQIAVEYDNGLLHADVNLRYMHALLDVKYDGVGANKGKLYTAKAGPIGVYIGAGLGVNF